MRKEPVELTLDAHHEVTARHGPKGSQLVRGIPEIKELNLNLPGVSRLRRSPSQPQVAQLIGLEELAFIQAGKPIASIAMGILQGPAFPAQAGHGLSPVSGTIGDLKSF